MLIHVSRYSEYLEFFLRMVHRGAIAASSQGSRLGYPALTHADQFQVTELSLTASLLTQEKLPVAALLLPQACNGEECY